MRCFTLSAAPLSFHIFHIFQQRSSLLWRCCVHLPSLAILSPASAIEFKFCNIKSKLPRTFPRRKPAARAPPASLLLPIEIFIMKKCAAHPLPPGSIFFLIYNNMWSACAVGCFLQAEFLIATFLVFLLQFWQRLFRRSCENKFEIEFCGFLAPEALQSQRQTQKLPSHQKPPMAKWNLR